MYVVLEIQQEQDGTTRVLEPAIVVMTPDGQIYKSECYQYIPPEPEPEPTPEEPVEEGEPE